MRPPRPELGTSEAQPSTTTPGRFGGEQDDRNQQALIDYFPLLQEWSVKAQPVPAHVVIHTDARRRTIRLDNLAIEFKQTAPSKLYWAGRPAMRIVQALRWLKDTLPTDRDRILAQLSVIPNDRRHGKALRDDLRAGIGTLPAWMQAIVRELLNVHTDRAATSRRQRPRATPTGAKRKPAAAHP